MVSKHTVRWRGLAGALGVMLGLAGAASGKVVISGSLPIAGDVGVLYSGSLSATDGGLPCVCTWTITGTPPDSVGINALTGAVSGTPTVSGAFSFTVTATNATSVSGNLPVSGTINPALGIAPSSLPAGQQNAPYSVSISATNGTSPGAVQLAGTLPSGLTYVSGLLSGTPTQTGTFPLTATVTDSVGGSANLIYNLQINPAPPPPLAVQTTSLPAGEASAPYSASPSATGGAPPYTWSITGLPAGLTFNASTGAISGPLAANATTSTTVVLQVTDGTPTTVSSPPLTLTVTPGPTITTAPALPNGTVGVAYTTVTLAASDGTPPYLWSIITGSLPQGLLFDAHAGTITGNPTASGPSNFTVQVSDLKQGTATKQFSITVAAGLTITTAPVLPSGTVGIGYSVFISAAGGTPSYTWSVVSGSLPNGLTLVSSTGEIRGFPSSSGSFPFTVKITDSASVTATKDFTLTVAGALTFTTPPILPSAAAGAPYSQPLAASGGNPPYTFNITAGALPNGLSLSTVSNLITGTPVSSGTFTFTIQVKDSNSVTVSQVFTLTVSAGLVITTPPQLPQGAVNSPYSQALAAVGGTAPYTWKLVQGTLPLGLSLSGGTIAGTPTANGSSTFTIQVMDNAGVTASQQFTLTIGAGLAITTPPALPPGTVGQAYGPFTLAQVGGTSPYTWAVSAGSMPAGLSLSLDGIITGTPAAAGAFTVTLQVKDSTGATAAQTFTISIVQPPQLNVAGVPQTSPAGQQISSLSLALTSPYPLDITGLITLSFQPDAVAGAVDPAMQFSTGGLTASYTIPANSADAVFSNSLKKIGLQTGTVSGTITLTFTLAAAGGDLPGFQRTIAISRTAPVIQSVKLVRTSAGLEVHVISFSPPRDLTEADLTFTAAPGATLQTTSVSQNISNAATAWYQGTASAQYGSLLMLVLPFTASQGSVDAVGSVSVVMKSAEGSSASVSGTF
jgi:hypothetical protein